jgi:catechol 2,3-dioxygenase-like lactoylglutathione lyase family enzyme
MPHERMIDGAHVLLYADDAEAARAFFRDVLGLPHTDSGDGWLIFALPPSELAVHPTFENRTCELYLMCDELESTVGELEAKGVEVLGPPSDEGWGLLVEIRVPGLGPVGLYEPRHARPPGH